MTMQKALKNLVVGITFGAAALPVFAFVVWDPTNWTQNYINATSAVKQEVTAAKALIQETQSALNMAKSVRGLADMSGITQARETLRLYQELKGVDGKLENAFQQSQALSDKLTTRYGASNMSWNEFINSKDQLDKLQRETSAERFRAINTSLEQTAQQRQAIVNQLGNVQGQTEAMQTVGAAIDVMIGQNQQIVSILASNSRMDEMKEVNKQTEQMKSEAEATKAMNSYQQRLRDAARKY